MMTLHHRNSLVKLNMRVLLERNDITAYTSLVWNGQWGAMGSRFHSTDQC